MNKPIDKTGIQRVILFATVWIFFSLNLSRFKIPNAELFRWIILLLLAISVFYDNKSVSLELPMLLWFYLFAVIPSVIFSVDKAESITKILSFVVVIYCTYLYFNSKFSTEDLDADFRVVMTVIVIFQLINMYAVFAGIGNDGERMQAMTTNANTLGIYSNLAFLSSFCFFDRTVGLRKLFFAIIMATAIFTAIGSGSRMAFITLVLNISLVILFKIKSNILRVGILAIIVALVYLLFTGSFEFLEIRALNQLLSEGGTSRGKLWDKGISVWRDHPVFGCGYADSQRYNDTPGEEGYPFHNSYITILAEVGIWGVVILTIALLVYFSSFFKIFMKKVTSKTTTPFIIGCLFLVELMLAAWSESFLFAVGSTEACTFWMTFMWCIVYRDRYLQENQSLEGRIIQ
ncbi:MAG: O-antigen ligase family protein [Ruminococcus sp.]|nr:O-antigen ligase family protein [Ruminococcus sp.]